MTRLFASTFFCALLSVAGPAAAALVTYDVDLNFDPTTQEGGTGVGTVKGTFTLNTSTDTITAIDLIEKTNTTDTIGGGFGSPTFTTVEFNTLSLTSIDFSDASSPLVRTQSDCCLLDGIEVGPGLQFDFPYPGGGAVTPGNFASITSESRYLYGSVTPTAAPEPSTWAMMLIGFAGLGFAGYRSRKAASIAGRVIG